MSALTVFFGFVFDFVIAHHKAVILVLVIVVTSLKERQVSATTLYNAQTTYLDLVIGGNK